MSLEKLKGLVGAELQMNELDYKRVLEIGKIVITISKDKQVSITVKEAKPRKKKQAVPIEVKEQLKAVKVALKNNLNATYLVVLLAKVHLTINNLELSNLNEEGRRLLHGQLLDIVKEIQQVDRKYLLTEDNNAE